MTPTSRGVPTIVPAEGVGEKGYCMICAKGQRTVCEDEEKPDTPTLRTAVIMYRLCNGERFTTRQAAAALSMSESGAYRMLDQISSSHNIPLTQVDGYWIMLIYGWDLSY